MATVESWGGTIADIGPVYPMVGTEGVLVIIGVAFWIVWHVIQAKAREPRLRGADQEIRRQGLTQAAHRRRGPEASVDAVASAQCAPLWSPGPHPIGLVARAGRGSESPPAKVGRNWPGVVRNGSG